MDLVDLASRSTSRLPAPSLPGHVNKPFTIYTLMQYTLTPHRSLSSCQPLLRLKHLDDSSALLHSNWNFTYQTFNKFYFLQLTKTRK
ncbi:hypothetical protein EYF80_056585 [Liparis tanakae]|uniref:Uncharacterized protein n=1 Tax=Liparis tanakae TaxID=230148 RepID=A0A4Z2EYH0_9TELE|nr:hypothetical protein EYF80_056585 [Liparis tanakae]